MTTIVDSTPAKVNLKTYRGDSWSQQFAFRSGGLPVDLSGKTLTGFVRDSLGDTTELVVAVVGDPTEGTILLAPPAGGIAVDVYDYDVQASSSGLTTTWVRGRLRVEGDVAA